MAAKIRASEVTEANWLPHLTQCRDNGTLARISDVQKSGTTVLVRRSDGTMQPCTIVDWGFAGRAWTVAWGEGEARRFKLIDLEDLLQWNPNLDAAETP